MSTDTLQGLVAGFDDEALGSQASFRAALHALAHPGQPMAMTAASGLPAVGQPAAARLLLALLDADCTLWLSPTLAASPSAAWLRFHTGVRLVNEPAQAQFAWVGAGDACPPLAAFNAGTDADPESSTTLVLDVDAWREGEGWRLSGPGIGGERQLAVLGLPADFAVQWAENHAAFPRGVDAYLTSAQALVGLPRTTRITDTVEA